MGLNAINHNSQCKIKLEKKILWREFLYAEKAGLFHSPSMMPSANPKPRENLKSLCQLWNLISQYIHTSTVCFIIQELGLWKLHFLQQKASYLVLYQPRELEENWKRGEGTNSILTSCCSCQYNPLSRWVPVSSFCWHLGSHSHYSSTEVPAPSRLSHFLKRRRPSPTELLNSDNYSFFPLFPKLSV